jgi:hypothetical protein
VSLVSVADLVRAGRIFTPLQDEAVFNRVRIGEGGRVVEWPEPADDDGNALIDIDAEALYRMGLQQRSEHGFRRLWQRLMKTTVSADVPSQSPPEPRPGAS